MTDTYAFPTSSGACLVAPDMTRFRLWAPSLDHVDLEIIGHPPVAMQAVGGGWYEITANHGAGTLYRYRINDDLSVPDPASRFQPEDVFGPSMVVDPRAYHWRTSHWQGRPWEDAVIYEIHVGLAGGYRGVRAQLPGLAGFGFTAIEFMPLSEFPGGRNWGYDGVLPYAPESAYGTPDELKALIDDAHELGLMVFLDVVYNHFGPDGNFLASYAAPFFRTDINTPWGAAIDFRVAEVGNYFLENALYWLMEYRFDGLRLDAVQAISERGWLVGLAASVRAAAGPARQLHLILENEHNDADLLRCGFDAQWNDDAHNVLHVILTGESEGYYANFAKDPRAQLARVLGEGFAYQGEYFPTLGRTRGSPSLLLAPSAFVSFLQNHDQIGNRAMGDRLNILADPKKLAAAYVVLVLCPQIPMFFMGEEWGACTPFLFFTSHNPELGRIVREGRRREFSAFHAFADPRQRELIPDPNDEATYVSSQLDASEQNAPGHVQWSAYISRLLALRHTHVIGRLRGASNLGADVIAGGVILARWRMGDGAVLSMVVNLGDEDIDSGLIPQGSMIYPEGGGNHLSQRSTRACSVAVYLDVAHDE